MVIVEQMETAAPAHHFHWTIHTLIWNKTPVNWNLSILFDVALAVYTKICWHLLAGEPHELDLFEAEKHSLFNNR